MVVDLFLVYQFVRRLATPFNKWEGFKQGVIDADGNVLIKKKDRDAKQKKAFGVFDVMVRNMKRLLAKVPGGGSKLASYAAALFLIKEYNHFSDESLLNEDITDEELEESLLLFNDRYVNYIKEDADVKALLTEKLKKSDDMGTWIKDFYDSDAPQFKGKSKEKRRQMAIAAKLDSEQQEKKVNTKPELEEEPAANSVGAGGIAGMDAGHMSKQAQKKWTKSNKSDKKKRLRDIMGAPTK